MSDTQTLEKLKAEHETQKIQLEILKMKQEAKHRELSMSEVREAWGDIVDPWDYPDWDWPDINNSSLTTRTVELHHRRDGENRQFIESERDLRSMWGMARWLTTQDKIGVGLLGNLTNYTIGRGFRYEVSGPDNLVDPVNQVLERFRRNPYGKFPPPMEDQWWKVEREIFARSRRDGDVFCQKMPMGSGQMRLRFRNPEHIREPSGRSRRELEDFMGLPGLDWSYGIATDLGDSQNIHGYLFAVDERDANWEFITPLEMTHLKLNVDEEIKRGLSDFFCVSKDMTESTKLLSNVVSGSALQAAIPWIEQFAQGTQSADVTALDSGRSEYNLTRRTAAGNTFTDRFVRMDGNTILKVENGRTYLPGPLGSQRNPNFIQGLQAAYRAIGVRWSIPEYMVSGDAANANMSSLLIAESPFVRSIEAAQDCYASIFKEILWYALLVEVEMGDLFDEGVTMEDLIREVSITHMAPVVPVRNKPAETQIRQALAHRGLISNDTWAAEEGYDLAKEHSKMTPDELASAQRALEGEGPPVAQAVLQGALTT